MISGKKVWRVLIIAVCFVLVISVASCGNYSDNSALEQLENLQNMQNAQTTEGEEIKVPSDDVQKYRVVISARASDGMLAKAIELSSAITEKTGKICTVARDADTVSTGNDTMEVQLGYVERKESREALRRLNRDDYLCVRFSDAVVLGGKIESATVSAVDKFISEILPRAEGKTLINDGDGFEASASYELNAIMLCDIGFANYDIVCDIQTSKIAENFRELFAGKCGAYSDISYESREGVREIIFKLSEGTEAGFCSVLRQGEDVLVESDSVYGLSVAVCKLYGAMSSSVKDGVGYINIPSSLFYSYEATDLSVVTLSIDSNDTFALEGVLSQLSIGAADLITVGAVAKEAWIMAQTHIPDTHAYELYSLGNDEYFPVIYNTAEFEDIYVKVDKIQGALCASIGASEDKVCLISVYETKVDGRQENIDEVLDMVGNSSSGSVAICVGALGNNSEFCVTHEGVSVEYLSCVGTGDSAINVVVMVTDKIIDCDKIFCEAIENNDAFCVLATVSNVYCAEYLDLIK